MENITSVSADLNPRNQALLILPVKKIPSKQRPVIFPAIKTLFYYKPLWPQQQTYRKNYILLLFYSGSQRTYIFTDLREKLKLPAVRQERILIKTFGRSDFSAQTVDIVVVKIKKGYIERFVEAICMSVICSELLNQNITFASQNYAHLKGLELAYCSKNLVKKIDMHIGLDCYYTFITGESLEENNVNLLL